jgi:hypothetical protein
MCFTQFCIYSFVGCAINLEHIGASDRLLVINIKHNLEITVANGAYIRWLADCSRFIKGQFYLLEENFNPDVYNEINSK